MSCLRVSARKSIHAIRPPLQRIDGEPRDALPQRQKFPHADGVESTGLRKFNAQFGCAKTVIRGPVGGGIIFRNALRGEHRRAPLVVAGRETTGLRQVLNEIGLDYSIAAILLGKPDGIPPTQPAAAAAMILG